ncbi:MAG: CocE/NonD family hydrolase [Dermatophilaceae bacterium]
MTEPLLTEARPPVQDGRPAKAPAPILVVETDVETPMRDGTVLRSTIYRPESARVPALLTRLPYGRDLSVLPAYFNPTLVAATGFAVVLQDTRGRFGSDGDFTPSVHEADDGEDTIAWLAEQPWCDGTVGMWGRSYFAETQWRAAARRPPALRAIAPGISAGGNANNGSLIRGGAVELGSRIGWAHVSITLEEIGRRNGSDAAGFTDDMARFSSTDRAIIDGSLAATLPLRDLAPTLDPFLRDHILPSLDPCPDSPGTRLWDSASSPLDLPTLSIGGWFDIFCPTTLSQYLMQAAHVGLRGPVRPRLVLGPWSHTNLTGTFPDVSFGMFAGAGAVDRFGDLSSLQARWFADVLRGRDPSRGALAAVPPVLVFVMGEDAWRGFDTLPVPPRTTLYLGHEGTLSGMPAAEGAVELTSDPLDPVPTCGGATMMHGAFPAGPADQRRIETRDDVRCFTSEALTEPLTVFGEVTATIALSTDVVDTDVVVRLCRVTADGRSISLCDGITRASWRDAYGGDGYFRPGHQRRLLTPGERYAVDVSLWATACTFAPGDRLRLQVTTSCHPRWDRNPQTGETAYHASATVVGHHRIHTGGDTPSRLSFGVLAAGLGELD